MLPRKLSGNYLPYGCQSSVRAACISPYSSGCENPVPLNFFHTTGMVITSLYNLTAGKFIKQKLSFLNISLNFTCMLNQQNLFLEKQHGIQVCYPGLSEQCCLNLIKDVIQHDQFLLFICVFITQAYAKWCRHCVLFATEK